MYKTAAGRYVVLLAGARDEMRAVEPFSCTFFTFSRPLASTRSRSSLHRAHVSAASGGHEIETAAH